MDEEVALFDDEGRVVGSALRSRVRAENLPHGGTAIVVRNSAGQVYVHRRTTTKDVFAGLYDFAAGGLITAGESPDDAAARELTEELGISGIPLTRVGMGRYDDKSTSYVAFLYTVTWDGPIRHQPEEIDWGDWMEVSDLAAMIAAAPDTFVPDSVGLWDAAFQRPAEP